MEDTTTPESRMVTIHIDPSYHRAMKNMAKSRKVLISLLYEQAVEMFLDNENKHKKSVKKSLTSSVPVRQ